VKVGAKVKSAYISTSCFTLHIFFLYRSVFLPLLRKSRLYSIYYSCPCRAFSFLFHSSKEMGVRTLFV